MKMSKRSQSLAGYIRQHLDEMEARLEVGVRQEVIVDELEAQGYKTTLKGFRNFLYRARQWAAQKKAPVRKETHESQVTKPANPLTKSKGFQYKESPDIDELI